MLPRRAARDRLPRFIRHRHDPFMVLVDQRRFRRASQMATTTTAANAVSNSRVGPKTISNGSRSRFGGSPRWQPRRETIRNPGLPPLAPTSGDRFR
jgi:hypothetical protein